MSNEIKIARKAIRTAISKGSICKETSGMHRVAINAIAHLCVNAEVASELAWCAVLDCKLNRK